MESCPSFLKRKLDILLGLPKISIFMKQLEQVKGKVLAEA